MTDPGMESTMRPLKCGEGESVTLGDVKVVKKEERRAEPVPRNCIRVGRNEPCFCGSGKKWKKCCGSVT